MIFGALGTQALGEVRRLAVTPPPVPTPGGAGALAGGGVWDDRFTRGEPKRKRRHELEDEEEIIMAYWYARENHLL